MSVCDGRPPRPNPEPWPEGRVPTNNLERLIASAPRPPEKPPAAPKAPDSHVIPPTRGTGGQQEAGHAQQPAQLIVTGMLGSSNGTEPARISRRDAVASASGCSKCGSMEIHACPGEPIPEWTPEAIAELNQALSEYETEPDGASEIACSSCGLTMEESRWLAAREGGDTSENGGRELTAKPAETRMDSGFEDGREGSAPAAGTEKNAERAEFAKFAAWTKRFTQEHPGVVLSPREAWMGRAGIGAHTKAGKPDTGK